MFAQAGVGQPLAANGGGDANTHEGWKAGAARVKGSQVSIEDNGGPAITPSGAQLAMAGMSLFTWACCPSAGGRTCLLMLGCACNLHPHVASWVQSGSAGAGCMSSGCQFYVCHHCFSVQWVLLIC